MNPLTALRFEDAKDIRGLFFDLDDTVLTHGVLERAAYGALWDLRDAGLRLVAVTGRPSGWAEVLVRQWPVDGAVTENGSVFVLRDRHAVRVITDGSAEEVASRRKQLDLLVAVVRERMPTLALTDDVHMRRSDVTWDIGEERRVSEPEVLALGRLVVAAGARVTRSSIHLHASFEREDKASGAVRFAREHLAEDPGSVVWRWAFVGDSANDAACFGAFRATFGVANVRSFAPRMTVPPRWVASAERGAGFAEIARALLKCRSNARSTWGTPIRSSL
jgi:HAD superfamily hydrolase (TIGR01484 family)